MPRFDQSFTGLTEQNLQETLQLKQRYLDAKAKRAPKSKDKKQQESIQSSVHVQQKFLKRAAEEHDPPGENFEPPVKLQCTTQQQHQNEGLTKFSVEIVQQLEFTTSAANSQPQQISANVTVKAHTNASVKSDVSSPKSNPSTPLQPQNQKPSNVGLDVGTLVECVKQEPDNDFADLDQCAAAVEKDVAANGGAGFGGFSDFMGDDTNDEIMSSAAFKDLISDISNYPDYPELMKDFDFEDKSEPNLKVEDVKESDKSQINQSQNQNYSPPVFDQNINKNRMGYSNIDFGKTELSPAAQTLKQMAEQHQHKNQMGLSFNPSNRAPNARSPYPDFQFQGDYGSPNSNFHKGSPGFQPDMIKQEMIFQNNEFDMKRKGAGMYNKQYSPYNSPSASSHGSPGYLPRSNQSGGAAGAFGGGTPPRPPSGPGGNAASIQINQAQQMSINQQNHGHAIQVSAGQHLHLSGDLKGNVSIAAQQGMHFSQQQQQQHSGPNQAQNQNAQNSQQNPMPNQSSMNMGPSGNMPGQTQMGNMMPGQQMSSGQNMHSNPNLQGMGNMMGSPNMQHGGNVGHSDGYSMSQSQTINFTQQTLRRANGPVGPNSMVPSQGMNPQLGGQNMGPRLMNSQSMEQQKLLHQQQMLRAQQQAAMQQHIVRPPPPEYKASAGMMQGMQGRYPAAPAMRRMPHQPMPPSGPMIRSNMYMLQQQQQQHMTSRTMYRQQAPPVNMEQHGNSEWQHLMMQNNNFIRPNFQQQGFNSGNTQMSALQMQQLRSQQRVANMGMQGQNMQGNQINSIMHVQQQQQQSLMQQQQQNNQISMSSIHMQQSQSISVSNQQQMQQPQQSMNNQLMPNQNTSQSLNSFNPNSEFNFEFLDNLASTDTPSFTDQELLNSFDSDAGFNLDFHALN